MLFNVHGSVHRKNILIYIQQDAILQFIISGIYTVYYIWKLLYMFRVVLSPIIRSAYNCIYKHLLFVTSLLLPAAIVVESEELELLYDSGR